MCDAYQGQQVGFCLAERFCLNLPTLDPDHMRPTHGVLAQGVRHSGNQTCLACMFKFPGHPILELSRILFLPRSRLPLCGLAPTLAAILPPGGLAFLLNVTRYCHRLLKRTLDSADQKHDSVLLGSDSMIIIDHERVGDIVPLPGGPQTRRPPGAGPSRVASRQRLVWCSSGSSRASAGVPNSCIHPLPKPPAGAGALVNGLQVKQE